MTNSRHNSRTAQGAAPPQPAAQGTVDDRWFRAVADYTYDWESWHSPEGRLIWVNQAVERMTGYAIGECLAMVDYPLPMIVADDRERVAQVFASARQRVSGENIEFGCVHRLAGDLRWMSLSWQPMYDEQGDHLGFRTSIRDVTERRGMRDQLRIYAEHLEQLVQERTEKLRQLEHRQRQMEKLAALGQLAAGVAHEINNPLAGMRNAFELIKSTLEPDHEHYDLLSLVDREIERISGIVHQMYQLYRRAPQQAAEFDVAVSIGEVITMLESAAAKQNVAIQFAPPAEVCHVWLPEGEVKQVLYNIVRNALQASSPGQRVEVALERRERELVVRIKDSGSGIATSDLPQIFDPFFTTKHGSGQTGMGLGLSVSRSLIEAMGGRIEVETKPNVGSRFSIVLPLRAELVSEAAHG